MKLVTEAGNETIDVAKRYDKYATAQAWLTDSALIIQQHHSLVVQSCLRWVPFHDAVCLLW